MEVEWVSSHADAQNETGGPSSIAAGITTDRDFVGMDHSL
jgi:hypothetical protein